MSHEVKTTLWASDDGSYGNGYLVTVDPAKWTKRQWAWFERLTESDEVYGWQLIQIDNGIKPDFEG
jgi:hypothetical protein